MPKVLMFIDLLMTKLLQKQNELVNFMDKAGLRILACTTYNACIPLWQIIGRRNDERLLLDFALLLQFHSVISHTSDNIFSLTAFPRLSPCLIVALLVKKEADVSMAIQSHWSTILDVAHSILDVCPATLQSDESGFMFRNNLKYLFYLIQKIVTNRTLSVPCPPSCHSFFLQHIPSSHSHSCALSGSKPMNSRPFFGDICGLSSYSQPPLLQFLSACWFEGAARCFWLNHMSSDTLSWGWG